ncbi:MAG TPA: DinB family protein [Candidatus Limnocylindrales bacterium]
MPSLISAVVSMLAATPARWTALAAVDPELLVRQPAPGEWSALECLGHVVDTEADVFRARVAAIREGRDFAAFDPDIEGSRVERSMRELAAELGTARAASLQALASLDEADLDRTARHAELGVVTMRELLNEWAAHDTMHVVQAERALMQAFIPASGPWRSYFADHDVEGARAE